MQNRPLNLPKAIKAPLFIFLLSMGISIAFAAYNYSIVAPSEQMLCYSILNSYTKQ